MSASDRSCSARSATSASFRCFANEASRVKEMAPAPMMFSANIVLGNQLGKSVGEEELARDAGEEEDQHEGDEPADGAHLEEDEGAERSQDPHSATPDGGTRRRASARRSGRGGCRRAG